MVKIESMLEKIKMEKWNKDMITKNQTNNHLSKRLYEMWLHFYHIKCGLKQMLHLPYGKDGPAELAVERNPYRSLWRI